MVSFKGFVELSFKRPRLKQLRYRVSYCSFFRYVYTIALTYPVGIKYYKPGPESRAQLYR